MSYSRWIGSKWYVYPSVYGWIECDFAGGPFLRWTPDMSYDDFKAVVNEQIADAEDREELFDILDENMEDIKHWFRKWRKEEAK